MTDIEKTNEPKSRSRRHTEEKDVFSRRRQAGASASHLSGILITAVFAAVAVWFFLSLAKLNILPTPFLLLIGLLLALLIVLVGLLTWKLSKKARFIIGTVLALLGTAGMIVGGLMLRKAYSSINNIIDDKPETQKIAVFVNKDDPAQTLTDAKDYLFGVLKEIDKAAVDETISRISTELGTSLALEEYESPSELFVAIMNHEVDAIIVNTDWVTNMDEFFEGLADSLRQLKDYAVVLPTAESRETEVRSGEVETDEDASTVDSTEEDVRHTARHRTRPDEYERTTENYSPDETETETESTTESRPPAPSVGPSAVQSTPAKELNTTAATPIMKSSGSNFVVYISGIDSRSGMTGRSLSDVNIIAVVNPSAKKVLLVNTPRDYYITTSVSGGARDKLTHAGMYGIECSIATLESLYRLQIDYYFKVDFSGFRRIINALGGVDVYSEVAFSAGSYTFTQGVNHLTGAQALAFARERKAFNTGDNQRGKNQMAVIKAVINKLASSDALLNYNELMDSLSSAFLTNMPYDKISSLVQTTLSGGSWSVESYAVTGYGGFEKSFSWPVYAYVMWPNYNSVETAKSKMKSYLN